MSKKVSIIISIKNRTKLFRRSLKLYNKQTMPKSDWELVVVDDMSNEDVLNTLKTYAKDINWQYIKIDSNKNDFPIFWGPTLSNNIGLKAAKGDVVVITGPEMLMKENAIELSYSSAMSTGYSVYGHILHSNRQFVNIMDKNPKLEDESFENLFNIPHARVQDITKNNFYWFWMAVRKDIFMSIGGCDEEYMKGICGCDDDAANRLNEAGAKNIHDLRIKGIHQDHKAEDSKDIKRNRRSPIWEQARLRNTKYLNEWVSKRKKQVLVNIGRDWGSNNLIIYRENNEC